MQCYGERWDKKERQWLLSGVVECALWTPPSPPPEKAEREACRRWQGIGCRGGGRLRRRAVGKLFDRGPNSSDFTAEGSTGSLNA